MKEHDTIPGAPGFDYNEIIKEPLLPEGVTCDVLGVPLAVSNMHSVITQLSDHLEEYRGEYVCVSNVHTVVMAHDHADYAEIQQRAVLTVPDGKPLSLLCRKKGYRNAERIAGPDLMPALMALSQEKGYAHYFYGGSEDTLTGLQSRLRESFPDLKIAGAYAPPYKKLSEFTRQEVEDDIRRINEARPDFVWVGLGAPKQERWMAGMHGRVHAVMLGVGAAFDFHAGRTKRAPKWMQEMYLEWLYRLLKNPRRLFRRYFVTNLKFLWLNLREGR